MSKLRKVKGIYAISAAADSWSNGQLTKDCGIIPYLFYQQYGYRAVMAGGDTEQEYPYLDTYVKGMELDCFSDHQLQTRLDYIRAHQADMDILILYGPYPSYPEMVELYRKLRPDGRIYLALDANSSWMDRILWDEPKFLRFLQQCDVIAASGRKLQRHLSQKWPVRIDYIPNGFYNFARVNLEVDFSQKENIILTVGRLGTKQKQTQILMEAFAAVQSMIPEWTVRLVGSVEADFKSYIDQYYERYPELKDRVVFAGAIQDKSALMQEYQKAKIFALTSVFEGGTPNVVAEALYGGCYMVTSAVDEAMDITREGRCGEVFPLRDVSALARLLLTICPDERRIAAGGQEAIDYAQRTFDFAAIIKRLHYLLCGAEK